MSAPANIRRTSLLARLLDVIWPRDCEVCGRRVDRPGRHVCSDCLMRLPLVPTDGCCRRCGRDVPGLDREFVCEDCRTHCPHFDRVASALRFEGEARQMMLDFKFNRHLWLRDDLVDWLEGAARARFKVGEIDLVVPMPTTTWHRLDRGFNQCDYLARPLARRLERPFAGRLMKRVGSPQRQGGLDEDERRQNVVGTFAVRRPARVKGACVLVVDDIMTTGSTLSECAKTLKAAGAAKVWAVTLCRSIRD